MSKFQKTGIYGGAIVAGVMAFSGAANAGSCTDGTQIWSPWNVEREARQHVANNPGSSCCVKSSSGIHAVNGRNGPRLTTGQCAKLFNNDGETVAPSKPKRQSQEPRQKSEYKSEERPAVNYQPKERYQAERQGGWKPTTVILVKPCHC